MKDTKIISIDPQDIDHGKLSEAARILRVGGTVAFPTETVYGLGANALDVSAVDKIFKAKGRPTDNPLIVHISDIAEIDPLVKEISKKAESLMNKFWPGPLTLLFKRSEKVPDRITAGLDTVAIRMPSHPIAKNLIKLAGVPVAAPSANISGRPSPTKAEHVIEDLEGKVDMIISGGDCSIGLESTVLDITGEIPTILRPGGTTKEQLKKILGMVMSDSALEEADRRVDHIAAKSPGMKYTHYSPKGEVQVVCGQKDEIVTTIKNLQRKKEKTGLKIGILATDETKENYKNAIVLSMGSRENIDAIAANLFSALRRFDQEGADIIFAESIEEKHLGNAIMNRMLKAAGYNVIVAGRK